MEARAMSELEKRITAALVSAITSADLAALIEETETAIVAADAAATAERKRALDPLVSPDPVAARAAMEDAAFTRDRLNTVLPRLRQRLDEVAATEYAAEWEPDFEQVKARRDDLAREFAELYPTVTAQLVDLFKRIAECDREVSRINGSAPSDEHRRLLEVELHARGLDAFTRDEPSIITELLKLPNWGDSARMAWPPPRVFDQSMFAPVVSGDPRLYTGRWHEVWEEQAAAAREREEREAAEREAEIRARPGVRWWERPTG
jgi:hypothetical protein